VSPDIRSGFSALGWRAETITGDLFDILGTDRLPQVDIITANLFLHHFTQPQLARLLAKVASCAPLFVACEPRRSGFALLGSRSLWAIGCNDVTQHDAVVSVMAGFRETELSAIWPDPGRWHLHEHSARLFTHCFAARRITPDEQNDI